MTKTKTGMPAALALVLLAASVLAGCPEKKPDPEETLRAFLADLRGARSEAAWAALSESSKKELQRRHEALAKAQGKSAEELTPERAFYDELGIMTLNQPETIVMTSPPGEEIRMRVSVKEGKSADFRMVREGSTGWKVDLMGSMKEAPPLEAHLQGKKVEEVDTATVP